MGKYSSVANLELELGDMKGGEESYRFEVKAAEWLEQLRVDCESWASSGEFRVFLSLPGRSTLPWLTSERGFDQLERTRKRYIGSGCNQAMTVSFLKSRPSRALTRGLRQPAGYGRCYRPFLYVLLAALSVRTAGSPIQPSTPPQRGKKACLP